MATGIFFAETFQVELGRISLLVLLLILLVIGWLLKSHGYAARWMFGVCVSCFMFLVGAVLTEYAWKNVRVDWGTERKVYWGMLQDIPIEKERTYQCLTSIEGKSVWLYFPKDSLSSSLRIGDGVLFYTKVSSPENRENIQEFDYASYLYHKGISGTAYVPEYAWRKVDADVDKPMKMKALLLREQMMKKYEEWGIGTNQLSVLCALTLGYKGDLDQETRDAYSVAGISHVLALSGMHVGILWFLLDGLFRLLFKARFKWLRGGVVIFLLWLFAFVVGLEASVVRAVIMCMLMELSMLAGGKSLSMNSLSVTAFFMLLYRPFYLYDVGFQLSFVAVASILMFYPLIYKTLPIENRMGRWMWGIMSVSIAAQLGTSPLVMYYFSNFSVYFLLTNGVAAVVVPLIIYGAVLMVLTAPWSGLQSYVVLMLNGLVAGLNHLVEWVNGLPHATFSLSVIHPVEIVLFYVMIAIWMMYWKSRRRKWLIGGLVVCFCLLSLHLFLIVKEGW